MLKVDISGVEKTILHLQRKASILERKADEFVKRLAELGRGVAELGFYGADYPNGQNDSRVYVDFEGDVCKIVAEGQAVLFIEFGAGDKADTELGKKLGYVKDSWSKDHGKQYHFLNYWIWEGEKYTYVTPQKGMYNASKEIRQKLVEIATEVFND